MYQQFLQAIIEEFNAGLCWRDIVEHWLCRCTVPGPGMRRAGERLVRRYLENGAAMAELIPYPADDRTEFLDGARNQLEWRPYSARLEIVSPPEAAGVICRFEEEPLCLICYSVATPPEGVEAEVVAHSGPLKEAEIQPGQWAGKIVLTDQFPSTVAGAIAKAGAIGLLSDCVSPPWLQQYPPVREPEDTPDLVMWTIFSGTRDQPRLFGFNLSPRQGRRLRELLARSAAPVRVRAIVQAEIVEGSSDFVHAALPGTELAEEEIWVLAHLSEPGARDNASGCSLSLELLRTLRRLTETGVLPPLRRTIRFMHAVEVSGFLPYIHAQRERLPLVRAGLCADSVAEHPGRCGGKLILFLSPETNASFIDGLLQTLLRAVAAEPARRFTPDNYALFAWDTHPFWGNDAFIADGFFDIPTAQLSAWPDRHYHSNQDLPADIDTHSLARIGAVMGTYLYLLATAGEKEAHWFGALAAQDFKERICRHIAEAYARSQEWPLGEAAQRRLAAEIWHWGLQGQDAIRQAGRFAPGNSAVQGALETLAAELEAFAAREAAACDPDEGFRMPKEEVAEADWIPQRERWRLPPHITDELARRVWPWINGRRRVAEIAARLRLNGPVSVAAVADCLQTLHEQGLVRWA